MSFLDPGRPEFIRARQLRRGKKRLAPAFDGFVARFADVYGVRPLDISTDRFSNGERSVPRLGIVLDRTRERRAFLNAAGNFDREKQQHVAQLFAETMRPEDLSARFGLPWGPRDVDWARELFVYFSEFEQTAISAAHEAVKGREVKAFVAALELGDQFWCTRRLAGPPIVFVHTDEQAKRLRSPDIQRRWADLYYPFVERHDEFGYLSRELILVQVDSRETFERDYSANWYYYFR